MLSSPRRASLRRVLQLLFPGPRRASAEAAYVARGAVALSRAGAHHLREQLDIVVGLARHFLAYRVQLFEESRFAIHINKSDKWQVTSDEQDFNSSLVTRHCFSVISETKNSG